jgi:hypothetical protein
VPGRLAWPSPIVGDLHGWCLQCKRDVRPWSIETDLEIPRHTFSPPTGGGHGEAGRGRRLIRCRTRIAARFAAQHRFDASTPFASATFYLATRAASASAQLPKLLRMANQKPEYASAKAGKASRDLLGSDTL